MTGTELIEWRLKRGWRRKRAARELKMPVATLKAYEKALRKIPGVVAVACQGIDGRSNLGLPVSSVISPS